MHIPRMASISVRKDDFSSGALVVCTTVSCMLTRLFFTCFYLLQTFARHLNTANIVKYFTRMYSNVYEHISNSQDIARDVNKTLADDNNKAVKNSKIQIAVAKLLFCKLQLIFNVKIL